MRTEYCDYVLAALCVRYCDCCAMSLWHQVLLMLCIRSVVYWVLGYRVLGSYALDAIPGCGGITGGLVPNNNYASPAVAKTH